MSRIQRYIEGMDRNSQDAVRSHLYAETKAGNYWPMCGYGWNRADGYRLSIFWGHRSTRGTCKLCERRLARKLPPVFKPWPHPTRWA